MVRRWSLFLCLLASVALVHSHASADIRHEPGDVRLYGGLGLGFGGTAHGNFTGPLGIAHVGGSDDLVTTVGGQVGVDVPVLRYLSLGGEARLLAFNTQGLDDNGVDRSKLLDIDFKPRLRFPLGRSPVEIYATVPIGLTVPFLANDWGDANVGWNIGVGAGVNWWITNAFALNIEPMFAYHKFGVDYAGGGHGDVKLQQFTLFLNAVFAL